MGESTGNGARGASDGESARGRMRREAICTVRYRRTVRATPSQALDAVTSAVQLLRYPVHEDGGGPAEIRFSALARTVTATVVDGTPGHCTLVVEFASLRWLGSGGSALVILPGVLLGAAVKAHDAWFAKGFLANVQRVLDGRGVGRDSARFPAMEALRERLDIAGR